MLLNVVVSPEPLAVTPLIRAVPPCALYAWDRMTLAPGVKVAAAVPFDWNVKLPMVGNGSTVTTALACADAVPFCTDTV